MAERHEAGVSIQVIERMLSLLDALADSPQPATLKTLAQATGLHPSTAHRILAVLTQSCLVERRAASGYVLGMRLLELGNIVKARLNVRETALPFMKDLHQAIDRRCENCLRPGRRYWNCSRPRAQHCKARVRAGG